MLNISVASESAVTKFKVVTKSQDSHHWQEALVSANHSEDMDNVWVGKSSLTNLVRGTHYSVQVASANSFGFGPFGGMVNFTTVEIGRELF